jgi:hypothetical protein
MFGLNAYQQHLTGKNCEAPIFNAILLAGCIILAKEKYNSI